MVNTETKPILDISKFTPQNFKYNVPKIMVIFFRGAKNVKAADVYKEIYQLRLLYENIKVQPAFSNLSKDAYDRMFLETSFSDSAPSFAEESIFSKMMKIVFDERTGLAYDPEQPDMFVEFAPEVPDPPPSRPNSGSGGDPVSDGGVPPPPPPGSRPNSGSGGDPVSDGGVPPPPGSRTGSTGSRTGSTGSRSGSTGSRTGSTGSRTGSGGDPVSDGGGGASDPFGPDNPGVDPHLPDLPVTTEIRQATIPKQNMLSDPKFAQNFLPKQRPLARRLPGPPGRAPARPPGPAPARPPSTLRETIDGNEGGETITNLDNIPPEVRQSVMSACARNPSSAAMCYFKFGPKIPGLGSQPTCPTGFYKVVGPL